MRNKSIEFYCLTEQFYKTYKKALTRLNILRNKEIIQKSTLQYFHTELEIK